MSGGSSTDTQTLADVADLIETCTNDHTIHRDPDYEGERVWITCGDTVLLNPPPLSRSDTPGEPS